MDQYRVFGNPIEQSKSPAIHQQFAVQTKQAIEYKKQLVPLDDFANAAAEFFDSGGKGANVTVPFKEQALQLCDQLSERATTAGAVNTLTFADGKIYGDNTDGLGLVTDLLANGAGLAGKRILILGAGGATKGVIHPLLDQTPSLIFIANRTVAKAEAIVALHNDQRLQSGGFEQANELSFDIIINATSAGLMNQSLPLTDKLIAQAQVCYDMIYGKDLTAFLKKAKALNVPKVIDGLGMLVCQAAESFRIWRDVEPEVAEVLKKLRAQL